MPIRSPFFSLAGVLTLLGIVAAAGAPAFAQVQPRNGAVRGQIIDAAGDPVADAHVIVVGSALGDAATTDGTFLIDNVPAGPHQIRASAVGFESRTVPLVVPAGDIVEITLALESTTLQSGEVVVTATRRAETAGGVAASISTLSARQIDRRNAVALDEALRYIPGVQLAGNQVNVRGSSGFSYNTGSRVLLLVDGMPMLRPDADGIPFDAVPMKQVQRIEVLKGPGSALYGGGALGGIIHVVTKAPPSRPSSYVDVYGGAYEPVRYDVWRSKWNEADRPRPLAGITVGHGRPLGEHAGVWVNVTYRYDAGYLRLDRKKNLQAFTKLAWRPAPDARFTLLAGASRRVSDSFFFWNGARDALNPGTIEVGQSTLGKGTDDNLIEEVSLQPSYVHVLSSNLLLSVKTRLFGVYIRALDEDVNPKPLAEGTVGFRYGGEVQMDYDPGSGRRLTFGAMGDANATRSGFFDADDRLSQPEIAAFAQWAETIGRRLNLTGGLRYDAYRIRRGVVERQLSPRLSAAVIVHPAWTLRLAYGDGFRVPSIVERYVDNGDYLPLVANVDVKPETSRSYEVGVRGAVREGVVLDAAAFWSDYHRLIEPTFVPSSHAFQFVNLTRARIRGVEITAEAAPNEALDVRAGYTFLDTEDLGAEKPLVFRSRHLLTAGADLHVGWLAVGGDLRIASKPERVDSDFARFIRDALMVGDTRVVDMRAAASWRNFRATVHLKNALDYYYLERPALLAPPRHLVLQLSAAL